MKNYTVSIKCCCNLKTSLFALFHATAEPVNCSPFLKSFQKCFCSLTFKNTSSNTLINYRNIYRNNLSVIVYQLPISVKEIEVYRLSVSPRVFGNHGLFIVIALVQKGLSCPSRYACIKFHFKIDFRWQ